MATTDLIKGRQVVVPLTNKSGGSVAAGDVVVFDSSSNDSFTTTTSAASVLGIGVVQETIANNASGRVLVAGYAPLVNVNASVTKGHFLFTHTVAKQAAGSATYGAGAFGVVLTSGTSPTAQIFGATAQAATGGAPSTAEYWVETADGTLSAEVVVGTTGITTAAYGSRQAAAKAGRLFLPSDGIAINRDTGAAWGPWGPIWPLTEPVDGDYAWINQGGASVSAAKGVIYLLAPAAASTNLRIRKKATPATPYTITAGFLPLLPSLASQYPHCGMCLRQSSDGKIIIFSVESAAAAPDLIVHVSKYTSATAFSAHYTLAWSGFVGSAARGMYWYRISDDGADRTFSLSIDGINFMTVFTGGRTDFLTADEVGFYCNADQVTYNAAMTLVSWKQA